MYLTTYEKGSLASPEDTERVEGKVRGLDFKGAHTALLDGQQKTSITSFACETSWPSLQLSLFFPSSSMNNFLFCEWKIAVILVIFLYSITRIVIMQNTWLSEILHIL